MKRLNPQSAAALALLGGLAALSGCASLTRDDRSPTALNTVVPAQVQGATPLTETTITTATAPAEPSAESLRLSVDARLQRLIDIALAHNRDLRIATLNVAQARAALGIREADLWPTVNAGLSGSRQPTGSGGINSFYSGGLVVTAWEIDLLGRLRNAASAAEAQLLASVQLRRAAELNLVAAVAQADIALRTDDALLQLARRTLRSREASLELVSRRHALGATSLLEVRQAESALQASRAALAQLTRQRAQDAATLALLLGQPVPAEVVEVVAEVVVEPRADRDIAGSNAETRAAAFQALDASVKISDAAPVPSTVLLRRPDVQAAEAQLAAANANVAAARANFLPRITLTTSVGSASKELAGLFASGSWAWSLAPQLLQPLFDAGRLSNALSASRAAQDSAVAQYERTLQTAFKEVSDTLAARQTLGTQREALQAQVAAERSRLELAEARWRLGASSYLEVLDAQRSLDAAEVAFVQALSAEVQARVGWVKVLGGR